MRKTESNVLEEQARTLVERAIEGEVANGEGHTHRATRERI